MKNKNKFSLIFALIGLLITAFLICIFAFKSDNNSQEVEMSETKVLAEKVQTIPEDSMIREIIEEWSGEVPATSSVILTNIQTGQSYESNETNPYVSASIYKLFIAHQLLMNTTVDPLYLDYVFDDGTPLSECLELMIIYSDESCGIALGWYAQWDQIDSSLINLGLQSTTVNNYDEFGGIIGDKITTPVDVNKFLISISSELNSKGYDFGYLYSLLLDQQVNDRIPDVLPEGIRLAHKTGNYDDAYHDVGYIEIDGKISYTYVIMTDAWSEETLQNAPVYFHDLLNSILIEINGLS